MNLFNRIFAILMLLLLMILGLVAAFAPLAALDGLRASLVQLDSTMAGQVSRFVGAGLVVLLSAALLYLELRRPARSSVLVGNMDGATAELSIEAITQRVRREVMALAEVRQVTPEILPRRNGVDARVTVFTSPDIDVPAKAAEVGQVVRQQMEQRMGLRVGQIWVNIRHEPYPAEPKAVKPH